MNLVRLLTGLLAVLCVSSLAAESLSRPAGLEPDIGFWRRVFAEITSEQAAIHDNRHLGVVYEIVDLPKNAGSRQRSRIADRARTKYRAILTELSDGDRTGLTAEQQRVLDLWPPDVSDDELQKATRRIRFQQGLADRFRDGLIRSGRWEPFILDRLTNAGVPLELASLPHVESSYNPDARSHVGASGLWQFTRGTGRRFMQIDHVVDERRDPFSSSEAAASLLQYNYSILKSWPLAITAYNHGVAGVRRAVRTTGTEDIETIVREYSGRAFGFASRNFYVAFLAANDVASNSERYFGPLVQDAPDDVVFVEMEDYVPVDSLASSLGVSVDTLRLSNPALLKSVWTGLKYVPRGYEVRIPAREIDLSPREALALIPDDIRFARQTPDLEHRVERGDSLSVIAARYNTSVSELMAINNLPSRHRIRVGQVINLPYRPAALAISKDAETYVVRSGDTISGIAKRAGISQRELLAMNPIGSGNRIYPGQELVIRAAAVAPAPAAPDPTPAVTSTPPSVAAVSPAAAEPGFDAIRDGETMDDVTVTIVESGEATAIVEPTSAEGAPASAGAEMTLLADPADYLVAADDTIEIQAAETLGHYADWLDIRTQRLRDANGYEYRQPVVIGHRLKLVFDDVGRDQFSAKRIAYHRELQEAFFARYRITDTTVHSLRSGESLYVLSLRRYKVPVWLLRQYNPDLDIDRLRPGTKIVFPRIAPVNLPQELDTAVARIEGEDQGRNEAP